MTNKVLTLHSIVPNTRPPGGTRDRGELFVNLPDRQLGVILADSTSTDLIAVRFWCNDTSYVIGDYVITGGKLYRCIANTVAGTGFLPVQWEEPSAGVQGDLAALEAAFNAFVATQDTRDDGQDTAIAGKVSQATYDVFVLAQDARDDAQDALIAAKADKTYVDSQNAAQDAVIATKASITYVDQQNAVQDANTLALIVALG